MALIAAALGFALAAATDHGVEAGDGGFSELGDAVFHVWQLWFVCFLAREQFQLKALALNKTAFAQPTLAIEILIVNYIFIIEFQFLNIPVF